MPNNPAAPRVFICHASEDKGRFVIPFAIGLRNRGVDAWVDQWEIEPGDSIVSKIFDEGLGKADASIIVLSRFSVNKPWVREELDSAFVARVREKLRIIPLVIEECDIPAPLKHLRHISVKDIQIFEKELVEICKFLFNQSQRPPLSSPPPYIGAPALQLPHLGLTDSVVLRAIGDQFIERGHEYIDVTKLKKVASESGITEDEIEESLQILREENYIEGRRAASGKMLSIKLYDHAVDSILRESFSDYAQIEQQIAIYLCNNTQSDNKTIADHFSVPVALVNHVLNELGHRNLIETSGRTVNGGIYILNISARLKRAVTG